MRTTLNRHFFGRKQDLLSGQNPLKAPEGLVFGYYFVFVAPTPAFAGLRGNDHRMFGFEVMFGGVLVFGIVAAINLAAGLAGPQMNPAIAEGYAFIALVFGGRLYFGLV
jgi:hypothetical protein